MTGLRVHCIRSDKGRVENRFRFSARAFRLWVLGLAILGNIAVGTILTGCVSSGHEISAINRTLVDIRTAVKSLCGVQSVSENEHEIITPPCRINADDTTPIEKLKELISVRILIIGDRRPYDILVEAYLLRRNRLGTFVEVGFDERLSKEFAKDLHQHLIEGRGNWNVIDDFRAF